jgi:hypothetical protein
MFSHDLDPKATFPLGARYGRDAHMSGPSVEIGRPGLAFVQRTGDGAIVEFRRVVDAVRCAVEVQNAMIERNSGVPEESRIVYRIGIHLGDVVEESDGDGRRRQHRRAAAERRQAGRDLSIRAGP